MQNHWNLGRWLGIPVTMDWTVLLAFAWLFLMLGELLAALVGAVAFGCLLAAHEFGHVAMARWRRVPVYGINFNGLHGETARGHAARRGDEILVAWGGVLAQLLILVLALAASQALAFSTNSWVSRIAGPWLMVWTRWNVFLIIVALLPIGPMDGHAAWKVIPFLREKLRRRPQPKPASTGKVVELDAARRRALEAESAKAADEIINRLKKK
ncbi:hypothetical protein D0B54_10605 [Solimonas sp. K1W22B-7]|uniref:hypothetical protein n=1 Tax=Solimonas sp. K1W22B-7 TaxID=2303331 RepID=UPI000E333966|nr:hypothetical protein [Solimonas sp. K1W22B-7]AXQ29109.1 hypothetical protein D0B54_10605 [Solimonas sp. K1W22B-7]